MVFSDGVFFDPADRLFKMWYMAGYQQHTALAVSRDGVVVGAARPRRRARHQHRLEPAARFEHGVARPRGATAGERFKMAGFDHRRYAHAQALDLGRRRALARRRRHRARAGDRSTFFRNPFRGVWVFSLRADEPDMTRYRQYVESRDFQTAQWDATDRVTWVGADTLDVRRADLQAPPQIYNLDAVAYESVMLGLFTMFRGERPDREKPNDLCVAFSRDGFHWSRTSREPFIPVSERQGDWNWGNVQSAGGCCLVVGDRLYFYVSGRQGIPGTNLPGECSTGLATLRRDGFASLTDQWPPGAPRLAAQGAPRITTRPIRFSGRHLFVNASIDGSIRVEVLDADGRVIEPFTLERCVPVSGDGTRLAVKWTGAPALSALAGQVVRLRFTLARARLFAFWISPSAVGREPRLPRRRRPGILAADGRAPEPDRGRHLSASRDRHFLTGRYILDGIVQLDGID